MVNSATIVSALLTNINSYRNCEKYVELGEKLLVLDVPKVIFMDKKVYNDYYKEKDKEKYYSNTHFIPIDHETLYLNAYRANITEFDNTIITGNKGKDNIDYMFVQCNKTEWIQTAIELNIFHTNQFIWVDFGMYHMINNDELFTREINRITNLSYDNIRIPGCWNIRTRNILENDIYKRITWFFAGSMFGGPADKLLEFASHMKERCLHIIHEKRHIMWEVNIWYLVYKDYPELFDQYIANHDLNILLNY